VFTVPLTPIGPALIQTFVCWAVEVQSGGSREGDDLSRRSRGWAGESSKKNKKLVTFTSPTVAS
jgi:hypothetical protein